MISSFLSYSILLERSIFYLSIIVIVHLAVPFSGLKSNHFSKLSTRFGLEKELNLTLPMRFAAEMSIPLQFFCSTAYLLWQGEVAKRVFLWTLTVVVVFDSGIGKGEGIIGRDFIVYICNFMDVWEGLERYGKHEHEVVFGVRSPEKSRIREREETEERTFSPS